MPLPADRVEKLEGYIRSSCDDVDCSGFLSKFITQVNDARFGTFLSSEMGLVDPASLIESAFKEFSVLRYDGINPNCIDAAVQEIVNRVSHCWPAQGTQT